MAYTHDDVFKPLPGYKVLASHFHFDFNEMLRDQGSLDYRPPWMDVLRNLSINIVNLGDFHDDSHPGDPGPVRFKEQKVYFEGSARLSDRDFLVIPGEEPNVFLGGHWRLVTPSSGLLFASSTAARRPLPFMAENDPMWRGRYITWVQPKTS